LAHPVNQEIASLSSLKGALSLGLLIGLFLFSYAAAAQVYPVSGVWATIDSQFPTATNETCIAVRTFGVEAVSKKSISEMIIFTGQKRFDVKSDAQTETTIKSIKPADGGFWITETLKKRRWLGFRRKATYFLGIIDPQTIEIRDAKGLSRYVKCGSKRAPI
jgi:hypothetical protein